VILALLLAVTAPQTAVDAERAFAADAQKHGQWTAFRHWASDRATMYVPKETDARQWLKDRKDPPLSVRWQPAASFVSCDGSYAVNTGSWQSPDGSVGYFTTVWMRQPDGKWRWLVDRGDTLKVARPVPGQPRVRVASCDNPPRQHGAIVQGMVAGGEPGDFSLIWFVKPEPNHVMRLGVFLWNGTSYDHVLADDIAMAE